ncbi:MAG TPA: DUF5695 domain-containing protein, partial [Edaphobacter sp.]|nr:DUF5695 domain-containing protein [Edaphobacter sp.]
RTRLYIAPLGLWLTLDAGKFTGAELDAETGSLRLMLAPRTEFTPAARLRIEQPAKIAGVGKVCPATVLESERGAWIVPLKRSDTEIELKKNSPQACSTGEER